MFNNYYFDNSATTRTRREVQNVMKKYFNSRYGNPSSTHKMGMIAKGSIEMARESIATVLNSKSHELIFTGSGSEANNSAIYSALESKKEKKHIITSRIEHSSVYNTMLILEKKGYKISYLPVDSKGRYDLNTLEKLIDNSTVLISLGYANNEIGTIQDVNKIVEIATNNEVLIHFDAVQALPYEHIDLTKLNADFVTFSGHKLYAPKGIGLLYIKDFENFTPLITGGGQEFGLRSGTENVPYILGLSKAIVLNKKEKDKNNSKLQYLRKRINEFILKEFNDTIITGDIDNKVPSIASFAFKDISGKALVKRLASYNISVSSGSACSSSDDAPSRILKELSYDQSYINGNLRISFGKYNSEKQLSYLFKILKKVITEEKQNKSKNLEKSYISQDHFRSLNLKDDNYQVIDVRIVSIPNIPLENIIPIPIWKLKKSIKKLNPDLETILICNDGDIIGPEAQSILVKKGFKNVKVLSGGSKILIEKIARS